MFISTKERLRDCNEQGCSPVISSLKFESKDLNPITNIKLDLQFLVLPYLRYNSFKNYITSGIISIPV